MGPNDHWIQAEAAVNAPDCKSDGLEPAPRDEMQVWRLEAAYLMLIASG